MIIVTNDVFLCLALSWWLGIHVLLCRKWFPASPALSRNQVNIQIWERNSLVIWNWTVYPLPFHYTFKENRTNLSFIHSFVHHNYIQLRFVKTKSTESYTVILLCLFIWSHLSKLSILPCVAVLACLCQENLMGTLWGHNQS